MLLLFEFAICFAIVTWNGSFNLFLLSTNASDEASEKKLFTTAARMRVCGCKNLDEKSFAMSASFAMMNNGLEDPDTMLRYTRRLKDLFSKMPSATFVKGPANYPELPEELLEHNPGIKAQIEACGTCTANKVSEMLTGVLKASAPCRNTKQGVTKRVQPELARRSSGIMCGDNATLVGTLPPKLKQFVEGMKLAEIATPQRAAANDDGAAVITFADGRVFRISGKQAADAASAAFPDRAFPLTFAGSTPVGPMTFPPGSTPVGPMAFPPGLLTIGAGPQSDSQNSESQSPPPDQNQQPAKPDKDKLSSMNSFCGQQGLSPYAPEQPAQHRAPEQLAKTEATAGTAEHT